METKMAKPETVLFVVYRPEWWGCFDSLCRQECSRENVTCYVLPVPRYERDVDTKQVNFNRKHFCPEALTQLPTGAVLADFRTFSPDRRFDRIYTHNPYDNTNPMDSADAAYYSASLKACTDRLIYVPHMLYLGGLPDGMKRCAVYKNADAILLSDERVRYALDAEYDGKVELVSDGISEYLDRLGKQRDAVRTDGKNRKKRLLYCVSFADLFYGTEKQLRKMWDIFQYMEGRKDVELVFRPDEDIPARACELNQGIYREYQALVAYFRERKIGAYDENPNPYQAAVEADGIMTAGHPLSAMFSVQGKPVLWVDREHHPVPTAEERCTPCIWAAALEETEDGAEAWFVPFRTRLLCRMRLRTKAGEHAGRENGRAEIVAEVPEELAAGANYANLIKAGDTVWLSPYESDGIWKYDLGSGRLEKHYLPSTVPGSVTLTIPYGESLYLIPRNYPGIVKYHMTSGRLQLIDGWVKEIDEGASPECRKNPYFIWAVRQEQDRLYMASSKCDAWLELDLHTDCWKVRSMNLPGRCFIDMVKDGDWVWLLPFDGQELIRWNCETGESKVIYVAEKAEAKYSPYERLLDCGDELIAFPKRANRLLVIPKKENGEIRELTQGLPCGEKDYPSEFMAQFKTGYQLVERLHDGRILAYEYYDGAFLLLDEKLCILEKVPCRLPPEAVKRQQSILWEREQCQSGFTGVLHEGYSLSAMLDFFVEGVDGMREEIAGYYAARLTGANSLSL